MTRDSTLIEIQALIWDSLGAAIGAGEHHRFRYLVSTEGMNVVSGVTTLDHTVVELTSPASCVVGPAGGLDLSFASFHSEPNIDWTFVAQGTVDWSYASWVGAQTGLNPGIRIRFGVRNLGDQEQRERCPDEWRLVGARLLFLLGGFERG